MGAQELNAIVRQKIEVSPSLIILRVAPDGWDMPEFKPGQFNVLALPGSAPRCKYSDEETGEVDPDKLIKRAYSASSASSEKEYVEFYITLLGSGALTPRLFALEVGDKLWMGKKFTGMFTIDDIPKESNIVFLATGTGLAPYMSMIRSDLDHTLDRRYAVLHGANHSWDLGYEAELLAMQRMSKNFTYLPMISMQEEEPSAWKGYSGFVQELWTEGILEEKWGFKPTAENTHVLLCGNPLMIEFMVRHLTEEGYTEQTKDIAGQLHLERYW